MREIFEIFTIILHLLYLLFIIIPLCIIYKILVLIEKNILFGKVSYSDKIVFLVAKATSSDITECFLREDFLIRHKNSIDWTAINYKRQFSKKFLIEMKDYIKWEKVVYYEGKINYFSDDTLLQLKDYVIWDRINYYKTFSHNFLAQVEDKINWTAISNYYFLNKLDFDNNLPENLANCFPDKIIWDIVNFKVNKYSEKFLRRFQDKIKWDNIKNVDYSENFILEFKHKFHISYFFNLYNYRLLSETCILQLENFLSKNFNSLTELRWEFISRKQKLSENFIITNLNKLNLKALEENKNLIAVSKSCLLKIGHKLPTKIIRNTYLLIVLQRKILEIVYSPEKNLMSSKIKLHFEKLSF